MCFIFPLKAQTKINYFIDLQFKNTSEKEIKNAKIEIFSLSKIFITDKNGKITLNIPTGDYLARVSAIGYKSKDIFINSNNDKIINIILEGQYGGIIIDEVEVVGRKIDKINNSNAGIERLEKSTLEKIPALLGEKDPVKAFQFLPGVGATSEGNTEMNVRGGGNDQNMFTLDQIPIYSSTHLFGLFSTFNPLSISSATLYKGDFPSSYGGRLSSVTSLTTVDTITKSFIGEAELGIATAKAALSIPMLNGKSSIFFAGRRSYYDLLFKTFGKGNTDIFSFQDYNLGWVYQPNLKNSIKLTLYHEVDAAGIILNEAGFSKGNADKMQTALGLNWKYRFNNQISNDVTFYHNNYNNSLSEEKRNTTESYRYNFKTAIADFGLRNTLTYAFGKATTFLGFEAIKHNFMPTRLFGDEGNVPFDINKIKDFNSTDLSFFIGSTLEVGTNTKLSFGLRNNNYFVDNTTYHSFEPRLSYHYSIKNNSAIKLSYSKMTQPILRLSNPGLGLPQDIILSANDFNRPQTASHFSLEFIKDFEFDKEKFTFSVQPFYKKLNHILSFKDGFDTRSLMFNSTYQGNNYSEVVTTGKGNSYGIELMLEKKTGKLNGWINYTYLKATNQFDALNGGLAFSALQDRRHNLNLVANWRISNQWDIGFSWTFISGQPITIPNNIFLPTNSDYLSGKIIINNNSPYMFEQGERNNYRMKPFHKLDITSQYNFRLLGLDASLNLGAYNVYNRSNSSFYYVGKSETALNGSIRQPVLKSVSLFPIVPSLSLKVKF